MNPRLLRPLARLQAGTPASLLLHFDGDFTDSSPNGLTVTAEGDATTSAAQSKWGGASGFFDGSGDYLAIPAHPSLNIGSGDFTIEMWAYLVEQSNVRPALLGNASSYPGGGNEFALLWDSSYGNDSIFIESGLGNYASSAVAKNAWHHIALTRSGETVRLFVDGVQEASETSSVSLDLAYDGGEMLIGRHWDGTDSDYQEFIDEIRITKGVARYTAAFTPPTAAFPNS